MTIPGAAKNFFASPNGKLRMKGAKDARRRDVHVSSFSIPAFKTCPGFSQFCVDTCYADPDHSKGFRMQTRRHEANRLEADTTNRVIEAAEALPKGAWHRIHTSGDFFSVAYIQKWVIAASLRPDVRFWGYTRSWRIPALRKALEALRALPNVQLFASIDPTIDELPPEGWRVAAVATDERFTGLVCPEQTGKMADCVDCGFCPIAKFGNVIFKVH